MLSAKKPYFVAAMLSVLVLLATVWIGLSNRADASEYCARQLETVRGQYEPNLNKIEQMNSSAQQMEGQCKKLTDLLMQRTVWPMLLNEIYRLKPDDLWLTSLKPIYGEVAQYVPTSIGPTIISSSPGEELFSSQDSGMMFSTGDSGGGGGVGQMVKIGGLNIEGMYAGPTKGSSEVTEFSEPDFPFPVPPSADSEASTGESGENLPPAQPNSNSPEIVFLERLRSSRLFSSDPAFTALRLFKQSPDFKNAGSFTMQIKFEFPLEYMQYGGH
jgi:hypothetical protein